MRPGFLDMREVYLAAFFLLAIDALVVWRAVQRLVLHEGTISPDAPLFLLLLLALQILLLIMFFRFRDLVHYDRRLRATTEQQLELSNQILDCLEVAVAVLDENGCYVFANRACAEMLGVPAAQLLGQSALGYVVEQSAYVAADQPLPDPLSFRLENQEQYYRATLRRADGQQLRVFTKVTPRWHAGRMVGSIATVVPASFQDT